MKDRWRSRSAGLAIILVTAAIGGVAWTVASAERGQVLVVRLPDGTRLAAVPLNADGEFALRYRNSLYGSLAEERFVSGPGRAIRLVELAADELAVLEEYYAIDEAAHPAPSADSRVWTAESAQRVSLESLVVAATDRGERTLLVDGQPDLELWHLVEDGASSVVLTLEAP